MQTSRRQFIKTGSAVTLGTLFGSIFHADAAISERPNILWLTAEDLSPDLGCYGDRIVKTPNLDSLARQGMRFTQAFSSSPVCSASRSGFITGMYQTSIGAHNHRSHRHDSYILPDGIQTIPELFSEAGYFTCNMKNSKAKLNGTGKTDWNFNTTKPFEGNDWTNRKEGQPFFAHLNLSLTHRKFLRSKTDPTDPAAVEIPPYYPDHPITREDWAQYCDTINHLDAMVGNVLKHLDEEGLSDNTIVFFFGDHGRPHVRGKQWLYEGGIHVPLILRWPGKIKANTVNTNLVSLIDLAPTSLKLAGLAVPDHFEGQDMLGEEAREYIVAARDRCDETVDRIRCVRDAQFKYIRNFMPERPYLQLNRYKEREYPVLRLLRRLHRDGKLPPAQQSFLASTRPPEELYDIVKDPHELHNLAASPAHEAILEKMRTRLATWIETTGDQGEIPEDPTIALFWKNRMQALYDKDIIRLYKEEGMEDLLGILHT